MSALRLTVDAIRAGVRAAIGEIRAARFAHQPVVQERLASVRENRRAGKPTELESTAGLEERLNRIG